MSRFDPTRHPDRFFFEARAKDVRRAELHRLAIITRARLAVLGHDLALGLGRFIGVGPTSAHH